MAKNPYDCGNFPGKFTTVYVGPHEGMYAFRVCLDGHKGLDTCMFEMELSEWLMEYAVGKYQMGNHFTFDANAKRNDTFVLLQELIDVVMFERQFVVTGLTPMDLAV